MSDEPSNDRTSEEVVLKKLIVEQLKVLGVDTAHKLSLEEKKEIARREADIDAAKVAAAETHSTGVATEFIRLEVQIATILFVLTGIFANSFHSKGSLDIFWVKIVFLIGVFSLIVSLLMGLLYLKSAEKFWDSILHKKHVREKAWMGVLRNKFSFEEAEAYRQGSTLENGHTETLPRWTWMLQSIFLGIGIVILYVLFVASMFATPSLDPASSKVSYCLQEAHSSTTMHESRTQYRQTDCSCDALVR